MGEYEPGTESIEEQLEDPGIILEEWEDELESDIKSHESNHELDEAAESTQHLKLLKTVEIDALDSTTKQIMKDYWQAAHQGNREQLKLIASKITNIYNRFRTEKTPSGESLVDLEQSFRQVQNTEGKNAPVLRTIYEKIVASRRRHRDAEVVLGYINHQLLRSDRQLN